MGQYFNRPGFFDEAGKVSIKKSGKPGLPIVLEILLAFAVCLLRSLINQLIVSFESVPPLLSGRVLSYVDSIGEDNIIRLWQYFLIGLSSFVAISIIKLFQKRKYRTYGYTFKNLFRHSAIGIIIGCATILLAIGILIISDSIRVYPAEYNRITVLLYFIAFLFMAHGEELLFRGQIMVSAARRYPVWVAVLVNSAVMAISNITAEGVGFIAFMNMVLFSILMSMLFIRTGNLWMITFMHASWNFVQGNIFGFLTSGVYPGDSVFRTTSNIAREFVNGAEFGIEGGLAASLVLCLSIAFVLLFVKPCKDV